MADEDENSDEARRPPSQKILEELELLRRDHGISPTKIHTHAPSLVRLPVVEDQQRLKQLDPSDRHLAAYAAIGCVIDFGISDYELQTILILSMRYDPSLLRIRPNPEWDHVIRTTSLDQRHKFIQAVLYYGKTKYFERLNIAYRELANQLVLRDYSPCREAGVNELAKTLMQATMKELLIYFSTHGQTALMEVAAKEALPQVESEWKAERPANYSMFAHAIESALASGYQRYYYRQVGLTYGSKSEPLPEAVLRRIILKNRDLPLIDRVSVEVGISDPPSGFTRYGRPIGTRTDAYARFDASLEILAAVLEGREPFAPPPPRVVAADELDMPSFNTHRNEGREDH